jgi:DNA-binding transcriptional LysR family regulator
MQVVLRDSGHANPRDDGWLGATLRWTVSSMQAVRLLVAGGLGFAWLPEHMVAGPLRDGTLQRLPLREGRIRHVTLYLVHSQPDLAGPATRRLADELIKATSGFPRGADSAPAIIG